MCVKEKERPWGRGRAFETSPGISGFGKKSARGRDDRSYTIVYFSSLFPVASVAPIWLSSPPCPSAGISPRQRRQGEKAQARDRRGTFPSAPPKSNADAMLTDNREQPNPNEERKEIERALCRSGLAYQDDLGPQHFTPWGRLLPRFGFPCVASPSPAPPPPPPF